jgi:hypothetical protein
MSEQEQTKPLGGPGRTLRCDEWENLLADALDGTLSVADQAAFTRHQNECALCAQMFKETDQGKAWMQYLTVEPEVPADLLGKILARTSETAATGVPPGVALPGRTVPARPWQRVILPAVRQVLEPRLMMTAAMAFFSIALTLNLTGIKLTQLRMEDLQPSRLRANLTRTFYSTNEQVTKYYENLRVVYEMESRVRELRRATAAEPAPTPRETPKAPARDGSGTPSSTVPRGQQEPQAPGGSPTHSEENAALPADMVAAGYHRPGRSGALHQEVFRALRSITSIHEGTSFHEATSVHEGNEGRRQRSLV